MRILAISSYFGPETSVGVLRINAFVKYWARSGHCVDVVTMPFRGDLPTGIGDNSAIRVFQVAPFLMGGGQSGDSQGYAKGATGFKQKIVKFQYWLKRKFLSNYLDPRVLWWPKAARFAKKNLTAAEPYDFVFSTVPSYTAHSAAAAIKAADNKMLWVADYRDLWSGNPIFPGCGLVRLFERWHERYVLSGADLIVSINDPLVEELRLLHGGSRYLVIPNGFDDGELDGRVFGGDASGDRSVTGGEAGILMVYAGSILPGLQDPSPLLQAIKDLVEEGAMREGDFELRFYGDYSALESFPLAKEPAVKRFVRGCGKVSRQEILNIQQQADFLLFLGSKPVVEGVGSTTGVVSGKLFEYLISGTEVVAVRVTADMVAAEMLVRSGGGDYYGDDVEKLKQRIKRAIQTRHVGKITPDMSYLNQFRRSRQADKIIEHVSLLLCNSNSEEGGMPAGAETAKNGCLENASSDQATQTRM